VVPEAVGREAVLGDEPVPALGHDEQDEGRADGCADLRDDIRRDVLPVEPLRLREADRDRRVEVPARHVADGVRHREHGQAEGDRDSMVSSSSGRLGGSTLRVDGPN
jgi:hypothetical protein